MNEPYQKLSRLATKGDENSLLGNNRIYLTLIGGGAFGNELHWILNAIKRSLILFKNHDLELIIVSYGFSNNQVQALTND